jgi:hydroxymethylglutaryl-CoA lyase
VRILEISKAENRELNLYFSMAFGNPYGEMWKWQDVEFWAKRFSEIGIKNILLSDTTGVADVEKIHLLFEKIPKNFLKLILVRIFITDMRIVTKN